MFFVVLFLISFIHFQVREMVEIITREFIQMGGSAGEVMIATSFVLII